jgi:peroxiredoxin (alkyl hydroperoxide reductase subunit C)
MELQTHRHPQRNEFANGLQEESEMSEENTSHGLPRLNEAAPDFTAQTTQGPLSLASLRGRWVVLFSHPADFTPVCTTELVEFARSHAEFREINAQLVGLSVDSLYSHIAWIRNMEAKFGISIPYPLIADVDQKVASLYGMVHPGASGTATVRCLFVIDDKGILRAMIYYPLTTGRNIAEIVRLVRALQAADADSVATPANWQPGDPTLLTAPATVEAAEERMHDTTVQAADWYYATRIQP